MPLFEVIFKATHDCPFANFSRKFPSVKLFFWCNHVHDLIEVIDENQEEFADAMKTLTKIRGLMERSSDGKNKHFLLKRCFCDEENSISKYLDEFDILHISPVIIQEGWEFYRIIALTHKDVTGLFERFEEDAVPFEILRKVPFNGIVASSLTLTADALFSRITAKQLDALITAYKNGYYQFPRRSDVQEIAARKRVPRTTFQEHLRKAENKLIASLIPYIRLYEQAPPELKGRLAFS